MTPRITQRSSCSGQWVQLLMFFLLVGCGPAIDDTGEQKPVRTKGSSLWPQEPDSLEEFAERSFKKHMLGRRYLDASEWNKGRELFDEHFENVDSASSVELKIGFVGLETAIDKIPDERGSVPGIVFHYGLDSDGTRDSIVYAISLVQMKLKQSGTETAVFEYDEKGMPFYTISSSGSLQRPLHPDEEDDERREEWISKYTDAYFNNVLVQRHDTAHHVPVARHCDPEQEAFVFLQLDHLISTNGGTHVAVSSIVQHGFDTQGRGTNYVHAVALTAYDGHHLIDDSLRHSNDRDVDYRRASDLGNICPPKCKRLAPFPAN